MIRSIVYKFIYLFFFIVNYPTLLFHRVRIGKRIKIRGRLFVQTAGTSKGVAIMLGNDVCINSSLASNPIGGSTRTILNVHNKGRIIVADGVAMSNTAIVSDTLVSIGEYTNIGAGTCIYDTDFHSLNPQERLNGDNRVKTSPVIIGKRVFIGGHTIILKGVSIGDEAVIGAGSVVTKNVPSREIWAGNPARFIKKMDYDKGEIKA